MKDDAVEGESGGMMKYANWRTSPSRAKKIVGSSLINLSSRPRMVSASQNIANAEELKCEKMETE